jgi:hypothetical protein
MRHYKLALLGFGNVGKALARLLLQKAADLQEIHQITFSITGIATARHGSAINPEGIDLEQALGRVDKGLSLEALSTYPPMVNALDFINDCQADVLFENTPVNYESGQPAIDYIGKHWVKDACHHCQQGRWCMLIASSARWRIKMGENSALIYRYGWSSDLFIPRRPALITAALQGYSIPPRT